MVVHSLKERVFDEGHIELLRVLANAAGIAMETARLFAEEQKKSRQLMLINNVSSHGITPDRVFLEPKTDRVRVSFVIAPIRRLHQSDAEDDARTIARLAMAMLTGEVDPKAYEGQSLAELRPDLPEKLGEATGTQPKSLIRMFGPRGNPQAKNLFSVISYLQKRAGLRLEVTRAA